jgi:hypothetical protein
VKYIYVSIGNSDDKLSQKQWSEYAIDVAGLVRAWSVELHGEWLSLPHAQYQNACWCFEITEDEVDILKLELETVAAKYNQDWIAWADATLEIIKGVKDE